MRVARQEVGGGRHETEKNINNICLNNCSFLINAADDQRGIGTALELWRQQSISDRKSESRCS